MIQLNNIHKTYYIGQNSLHVLKGVDMNVGKGEMVSIMEDLSKESKIKGEEKKEEPKKTEEKK